MRLLYMWPLGFLALIPGIVFLYLLKQKAEEEKVPSLYLWQVVYKNLQATSPWEKLKNNLLMYLQILAMAALILALASPYLTKGGQEYENVILAIDQSGSMNSLYYKEGMEKGGKTRLQVAKEQAKDYVDQIPSDVRVTVIAVGKEASAILANSADRAEIKRAIDHIEGTDEKGNLPQAVNLASSMAAGWDNYQAVFFTDQSLDLGSLRGEAVSLNSEGRNGAVNYVSHAREADGTLTVLAKVSNTGNEPFQTEVNLYLDGKLEKVQGVSLEPGESQVLYFQGIDSDASAIMAEINEEDDLENDNRAYDTRSGGGSKKVLLVSQQNVFLEKAVEALPDIELYKTPDTEALAEAAEEELFDLYVFDGAAPETLPKEGSLLFFNPPETVEGLFQVDGIQEGAWVEARSHPVTDYVGDFAFGVNEVRKIETPDWAESFLSYGEDAAYSAGFAGRAGGRNVGVVAFDLHHSDLPLQAEFPILIYGLMSQCLEGSLIGSSTVDAGERVEIYSQDTEGEIAIWPEGGQKEMFPGDSVSFSYENTGKAGLYHVKQKEQEAVFAVNFPAEESEAFGGEVTVTGDSASGQEGAYAAPEGGIHFRAPLICLLLLLLAVEWLVTVRQGILPRQDKLRRNLIIGLEASVALLAFLALWNPSVRMGSSQTTTIFLVDVSDSVSGQKKEVEDFIKESLGKMPRGDKAGVVAFGTDSRVEQFVSEKNLFSGFETMPATTATNLEKAVQGAMVLFPGEEAKRLVLITDGSENEGSLKNMAQAVLNGNIQVQVKKLDSQMGEEVYVDQVQVPDQVNVGDTFKVDVAIESNVKTSAVLFLYSGSVLKGQREVSLEPGTNRFVFKDVQEADGLKSYRVIVEADRDTRSVNNEYVAFTKAEAAEQVLLIEGEPNTASAMEKVLKAANINYQLAIPDGAPRTLMEFNRYKSIVLLDVHRDDLPAGFMDNLEAYVQDYAGGLVAIGGDNSFALGGYRDTSLEKVLPVYMDLQGEKEIPKMAIALVIDRSGSMADGNDRISQLDLAKEAAASALGTLRKTDEIGVVAFESTYEWVVPMKAAEQADAIEESIYSIGLGGGTSIYPALDAAASGLIKSDAKLKHIILLTDGQDGFRDYNGLLHSLSDNGITLSTVAVGSGADANLLEYLAEEGGGRIYYTDINSDIPRIFAKEVFLSVNSYLVNEEFAPIRTSQKDMLDEVAKDGLPSLLGYIAATKKELATLHLMSDREDPILTSWQYGLGKTVAFNSDGENNWTANYGAWSDYPLFWKAIIESTMTKTSQGKGEVSIMQSGSSAKVAYTTDSYSEDTSVEVIATDEEGNSQKLALEPSRPGVFEGEIPTSNTGVYSVNVTEKEGEQVVSTENTATAVQYSSEYRVMKDSGLLEEWAKETGGSLIEEAGEIFQKEVRQAHAQRALAPYFLTAAIVLFMAAILCKRLNLRKLFSLRRGERPLESQADSLRKEKRRHQAPAGRPAGKKRRRQAAAPEKGSGREEEKERSGEKNEKKGKREKEKKASQKERLDTDSLLKKKSQR